MIPEAWVGDWRERVVNALLAAGYGSALEFFEQHVDPPTVELPSLLDRRIPPIQLTRVLVEQSLANGELLQAAAVLLARALREHLVVGWPAQASGNFELASAYSDWICHFPAEQRDALEPAWVALKRSRPPEGWLPADRHDLRVQHAFSGLHPNS